jgi:Ca2+/Na+ antiporter
MNVTLSFWERKMRALGKFLIPQNLDVAVVCLLGALGSAFSVQPNGHLSWLATMVVFVVGYILFAVLEYALNADEHATDL